MYLIVGLGNPGKEYNQTRHNIGYQILDEYLGAVDWQNKFDALIYKTNENNQKVIFVKPTTYMNLSGIAVKKIVNYFDISLNNILIIRDDLDLPVGTYRLKEDSSDGGHNGIKSIIDSVNSKCFKQLKIGVGRVDDLSTVDYVLGKLSAVEKKALSNNQNIFNSIIDDLISGEEFLAMQNKYNR